MVEFPEKTEGLLEVWAVTGLTDISCARQPISTI